MIHVSTKFGYDFISVNHFNAIVKIKFWWESLNSFWRNFIQMNNLICKLNTHLMILKFYFFDFVINYLPIMYHWNFGIEKGSVFTIQLHVTDLHCPIRFKSTQDKVHFQGWFKKFCLDFLKKHRALNGNICKFYLFLKIDNFKLWENGLY